MGLKKIPRRRRSLRSPFGLGKTKHLRPVRRGRPQAGRGQRRRWRVPRRRFARIWRRFPRRRLPPRGGRRWDQVPLRGQRCSEDFRGLLREGHSGRCVYPEPTYPVGVSEGAEFGSTPALRSPRSTVEAVFPKLQRDTRLQVVRRAEAQAGW